MADPKSIVAACPACSTKFDASTSESGQIVICPECEGNVMVPDVPKKVDDFLDTEFWKDNASYSPPKTLKPADAFDYGEVIVTTADLKQDYEVIGPVYFQLSNKGMFGGDDIGNYKRKHQDWLIEQRRNAQIRSTPKGWGLLFAEKAVGQSEFDVAFFIAVLELKIRATMLGGDAVIGMRQQVNIDTVGVQGFYLQMYGTAVKLTAPQQPQPLLSTESPDGQ